MLRSEHLKTTNYPGLVIESMQGKPWQKIMDVGLEILDQNGFYCQPGSGTLLGLIREKDGYIHHDTDIDIDVIELEKDSETFNQRVAQMAKDFSTKGFKLVRTQFYNDLPSQIAFIHKETNLIYDLCFFYNKWGTDWMNIYEHGVFVRPPYSVTDVLSFEFNGSTYIIPEEYDKYLTGRYGAWQIPTKGKESGEKDAADYLIIL